MHSSREFKVQLDLTVKSLACFQTLFCEKISQISQKHQHLFDLLFKHPFRHGDRELRYILFPSERIDIARFQFSYQIGLLFISVSEHDFCNGEGLESSDYESDTRCIEQFLIRSKSLMERHLEQYLSLIFRRKQKVQQVLMK